MIIGILIIVFFALLVLGIPIAFSLGVSAILVVMAFTQLPVSLIAQRIFVSMNNFSYLAIPFFMLAGSLMGCGGISKRLVKFAYSLFGTLTGGLACVDIMASMLFGGISGAAVADTAAIGGVMIPSMIDKKYPRDLTAAITGIASTLGIIIPPSIPMVVMGGMLNISVGRLFLGGIIPGILIGLSMMIISYVIAKVSKIPKEEGRFTIKEFVKSTLDAIWALVLPIIILVAIVGGVVSPTEAGAIAVVYAIIVGKFVYRELTLKKFLDSLFDSVLSSAKIYLIIGMAGLFSWLLTTNNFSNMVGSALNSVTNSKFVMMLIIIGIMLVVTTFMESNSAMILLLPVLYPIAVSVGVDPIVFGIMITISIAVGLVTPPVGLCLYISTGIAKVGLGKSAIKVLPYIGAAVAITLFLLAFPSTITYLPNLFMK